MDEVKPDATSPAKPAFGAPCNGCGLCCTATACVIAISFVPDAEEGLPCPALEWDGGRSWCGLIRHPERHVAPVMWTLFGRKRNRFAAAVAGDIVKGGCDSGPIGGIGDDEWLGLTAADYRVAPPPIGGAEG